MASNDKKDPLINLVDKLRSFFGFGHQPKNQTALPGCPERSKAHWGNASGQRVDNMDQRERE